MRKTITFLLILVMMVASISLALAEVTAAQGAEVSETTNGGYEIDTGADNSEENNSKTSNGISAAHNNPLYVAGE